MTSFPHIPRRLQIFIDTHLGWLIGYFSHFFFSQMVKNAPDHLLVRLNARLDTYPIEQACHSFHKESGSGDHAHHAIPILVRALIIRHLYDLSLRETAERVRDDFIFRWFVGYRLNDKTFSFSHLGKFEKWVRTNCPDAFFVETLKQIFEAFPEELEAVQIGDTVAMIANAQKENLVDRLRHTCHQILDLLSQVEVDFYFYVINSLDQKALFGQEKEKPTGLLSEAQLKTRTLTVVREAYALLQKKDEITAQLVGTVELGKINARFDQLEKIINDDFTIKKKKNELTFELKKHEKGAYWIGSATDPEATYRNHGDRSDLGYNISLSSTTHFITAVIASTGSQPDNVEIPNLLLYQKEHFDHFPPKLIFDAAAGTPKTHHLVAEATNGETQLVSPMINTNKSRETYVPTDLDLDQDGESLTCPNGVTTTRKYRHGRDTGYLYRFTAQMCAGCPLVKECRGIEIEGEPTTHRDVYISDFSEIGVKAFAYTRTEEYKEDMAVRPIVEPIISAFANHNGGRRARSIGLEAANFQAKMSAMSYNLKRWIRLEAEASGEIKKRKRKKKYQLLTAEEYQQAA